MAALTGVVLQAPTAWAEDSALNFNNNGSSAAPTAASTNNDQPSFALLQLSPTAQALSQNFALQMQTPRTVLSFPASPIQNSKAFNLEAYAKDHGTNQVPVEALSSQDEKTGPSRGSIEAQAIFDQAAVAIKNVPAPHLLTSKQIDKIFPDMKAPSPRLLSAQSL